MISSTYLHIADLRVEVEHCSNLDWSSEPDVVHVNAPWATFTLRIRKESKSISCKSVRPCGLGLLSLVLKSLIKSLMPKAPLSDFCIVKAAVDVLDG